MRQKCFVVGNTLLFDEEIRHFEKSFLTSDEYIPQIYKLKIKQNAVFKYFTPKMYSQKNVK